MQCLDYDTEAECEEHWIWDASASNGQLNAHANGLIKNVFQKI